MKFFKIKNNKDGKRELAIPDIPTFAFIGFSLGFLLVGVVYATFSGLYDADDGHIFSWTAILSGLASIGVCVMVAALGLLYWWLIPRKYGLIYPAKSGFGLLVAFLSFTSSVLIASEFVTWLDNWLKI